MGQQKVVKTPENDLLVLSDLHRGAAISLMPKYEKELCDKMGQFRHVVLNGDIFELFYVDRAHYGYDAVGKKNEDTTHIIRHAVKESIQFLKTFLTEHPNTQLHYVLGNHENIEKFRKQLNKLSKKCHNFEWSPEAIRIGDSLFVHGDLPMSDKTNDTRSRYSLVDATKDMAWSKWLALFDPPGQAVVKYVRSPKIATRYVDTWLRKHDKGDTVLCRHKGKKEPLDLEAIKHVFFGHTHVKFDNLELGGIRYHNTGALTKAVVADMGPHGGHGILQADIEGHSIVNVRPFALSMDRGRAHDRWINQNLR